MKYIFDENKFNETFLQNGKLRHETKHVKYYPYNTKSVPILDFENVTGMYICNLKEEKPRYLDMIQTAKAIVEKVEIEEDAIDLFEEVVKKLYFDADQNMLKNNLSMIQQGSYTEAYLVKSTNSTMKTALKNKQTSEDKIADYLAKVLGEKETILNELIEIEKNKGNYNICESLLMDVIKTEPNKNNFKNKYTKLFDGFDSIFTEDIIYVIDSIERTRQYLKPLLELYYFEYTVQTALQLDQFELGDRKKCIPIYFSLEWEKTSQSRKCYEYGWKYVHNALKHIFAHENAIELLNMVETDAGSFDYINLNEMATQSSDEDRVLSEEIRKVRELYQYYVNQNDPKIKITETEMEEYSEKITVNEYRYLYDLVQKQFIETVRKGNYDKYANNLIEFCKSKFVKNRGRSGGMLNLTEEMVIFLTKLAIKNKEKMRLTDVFLEFEKRGIYLDERSKAEIDSYYEKLNLIEKKSDSGDAKYVRRIL